MKADAAHLRNVMLATVAACGLGLGLWLWLRPVGKDTGNAASRPSRQAPDMETRFLAAAEMLRSRTAPGDASGLLDELRKSLVAQKPESAVAAIRRCLEGGRDAPTQLEFTVGPEGFLTSAPSLRVFLLDQLARLDRAAAAAYARQVLTSLNSPEEWAVCLRNLALADASAEARAFLQEKLGQMLRYEPWQQDPSVGYLEAFDVAVYLGGTNLVPALAGLVCKPDNAAVAHAAHLALERLTIQDAAATLDLLQSDPSLMPGRELARADLFARADVSNRRQRQVLENYLLNSQLPAEELNQFVSVYPNANFRVSQNLLTRQPTPDFAALRWRDAEALRVVNEWLADQRFAALKPPLEKIKGRLETFARQSGQK